MSAEENKALVRRFYDDVINKGDLKAIDKITATNFVDHTQVPGLPQGIEGVRQWFTMLRSAFPDARATLHDVLAEGDKVVTRVSMTATHKGEFMGIPATGKSVKIEGIDITRISGGKAVEHWGQFDNLGMMQQLGMAPPMGQPPKK